MKPKNTVILKNEDSFNAYVVDINPAFNGKLAIGCPCICKEEGTFFVEAIDNDGNKRVMYYKDFTFKVIK